jgi:hypothetical protein
VEEVRDQSDDKSSIASLCYQLRLLEPLLSLSNMTSLPNAGGSFLFTPNISAWTRASHASLRKRLTSRSCHPKPLLSPLHLNRRLHDPLLPTRLPPRCSRLRYLWFLHFHLRLSLPPAHRLQAMSGHARRNLLVSKFSNLIFRKGSSLFFSSIRTRCARSSSKLTGSTVG